MIRQDAMGGRTIELYIPFDYKGKKVTSISLAPMCFGHNMRWAEGDWKSSFELLVEVAGVEEGAIRSIRSVDADRVMEAFLSMLPADIRNDITNGRIPTKVTITRDVEEETPEQQELQEHEAEQQDPILHGPGVPMPGQVSAGFDMSDEEAA